jgi:hypothetical protein
MTAHFTPDTAALNQRVLERIPSPLRAQYEAMIGGNESFNEFWQLVQMLLDALQPRDIVDHMFVRDIVVREWDAYRFRRIKNATIESCREPALQYLLKSILNDDDRDEEELEKELARLKLSWRTDKKVLAALSQYGIDPDRYVDQHAAMPLLCEEGTIQFMEKRTAEAERGRNVAFNELKKCRERDARLYELMSRASKHQAKKQD